MKKGILVIGCLIGIINFSFSQTAPGIEWQKCYGGSNGNEVLNSLFFTSDTNIVITGSAESSDGDVHHINNLRDCWMLKIDLFGDTAWTICIGDPDVAERCYAIETLDGFDVFGETNAYFFCNTGSTTRNIFKTTFYTSFLNYGTVYCYGGTQQEYMGSAIKEGVGSSIIIASTYSNDIDVSGNHGCTDGWVVRVVSAFLQTQKCLGGSGCDFLYSCKKTGNGNLVLCGFTDSNDGDVTGNHGLLDGWIIKLDPALNIIWSKVYGGSDSDYLNDLIILNDESIIAAGTTLSNNGDVSGNHGGGDGWIIKVDSSGNLLWQKCIGGTQQDGLRKIKMDSFGNLLSIGASKSSDGDILNNHGDWDCLFLMADSSNGNIIWQKNLGGTYPDTGEDFIIENDTTYYLGAATKSNDGDVFGNHDTTGGQSDIWILKLNYDSLTSIPNFNFPISNIQISPSPFTTTLTIKGTTQKGELIIFDVTGKEILRTKTFGEETKINTSHLTPGFYFVNYREENGSVNKKVVKM